MDQHDIGRLVVKLSGIGLVCYALILLPGIMVSGIELLAATLNSSSSGFHSSVPVPVLWALTLAPCFVDLAIGFGLIRWGEKIVDQAISRKTEDGVVSSDWSAVEEIALAILGYFFVGEALVNLGYWIGTDHAQDIATHAPLQISPTQWGSLSAAAIRLTIGVLLLIGGRGAVALRRWLMA